MLPNLSHLRREEAPPVGQKTLISWLLAQQERDDCIGDLARDMADDSKLPHGNSGYRQLEIHLTAMQAPRDVRLVLALAYREYRHLKRQEARDGK